MTAIREVRPPSSTHNNADLLVWALYTLDGAERWVDVEELYLQAFRIAPARLSWRTRRDLPDYKKCAKALQELEDTKRSEHLGLIAKQGSYLRKLTLDGLAWCSTHVDTLATLYAGAVVPSAAGQDDSRRVREVTSSAAFAEWRAGGAIGSAWDLADAFRCLGDSPLATWESRFDEVALAARRNANPELESFVAEARAKVREELSR